MAIGNLVIYLVGVPWLMVSDRARPGHGLQRRVGPFLLGDIIAGPVPPGCSLIAWWVVGRSTSER